MTLLDEYDQKMESSGWKVSTEDKKAGLTIWQRTSESGLKAMKAESMVNFSTIDLFKTLGNAKYRRDYDEVYDGGHNIERIGD